MCLTGSSLQVGFSLSRTGGILLLALQAFTIGKVNTTIVYSCGLSSDPVTESTIIATIHCPDVGYFLFRFP